MKKAQLLLLLGSLSTFGFFVGQVWNLFHPGGMSDGGGMM
jgi:hypothetical protein